MSSLDKVQVEIAVVIGTRMLPLATLLRLGRGARLRLEGGSVEAVDILAGRIEVARGRLIQGRDERLAVEIAEVFRKPEPAGPEAAAT